LREKLKIMTDEHTVEFLVVPDEFATDNGAMIAWNGILSYKNGITTPIEKSQVRPSWRVEQIEIPWIK